ncbi:glycosyltransferase family 4 protein [Roseomonas nepalensis]|uniref:Glycosyltransferase family 4 protein n=1 Tax=Muricoccus nepalensis TaxID=1854500 RepID=A0A502F4U0_9PROT|nr:glycosyltransferase [Roseomonas nepalensis]TPG44254.1 glycosyltransferase family 4 protein [Roseomonas nepalensis]
MLRVLTISTLFPNAARPTFGVFVESQTLALAARDGVEVRVVNPIGRPPFPLDLHPHYRPLRHLPEEETWKGLRVARPPMLTVPGVTGRINPVLLARAVRPVVERWRREGFAFDAMDAQFFYPDGPAAALLAAEFGVPLLIKARGADIHYWGRRRGCRERIMAAAAQARCLLAVSRSLARDMAAMGMEAGKIAVHYTGCDLERFRPRDRAAAKEKLQVRGPLVVSLGSLIPRKGHDLVIEAMAELPSATLLVVGEGPERGRLQKLIERRGLGGRARLVGGMPHGELPGILAAADVMALASESEGLANAWIEALACGTPVVTPDVDGAAEAIDRPAAGRLLRERSPAAIAVAIRSILEAPPAQRAVRESAERFSWERNGQQLHEHLARIAAPAEAA